MIRALRRRRGWRQLDLAEAAGVSQSLISLVEREHLGTFAFETLQDVGRAVGASLSIEMRWRGGDLDRLLDEQHAALVERFVGVLAGLGWACEIEVSYLEYGERGSIDGLAWHPPCRMLLVVEAKTEVAALEGTLRKLDEKARLAPAIARRRLGWAAVATSRLLVLPESMTLRRRLQDHERMLEAAFPLRGVAVRRCLRSLERAGAGLWLLSSMNPGGGRGGRRGRARRTGGKGSP